MKRKRFSAFTVSVVMFLTLLSGISAAEQQNETISIASKEGIGKYLVTSSGKALYYFKKDSPGKSACFGPCVQKWPIYCFETNEIDVGTGINKADFGFFMRSDEPTVEQLTYKGMPLYEYNEDGSGDTKGHGINNLWFVVTP
jgi:predicted lipoprotein with Yx(FWY)xxD motif